MSGTGIAGTSDRSLINGFVPLTEPKAWGADLPGSPVMAGPLPADRLTIFFLKVAKWSDGTTDMEHEP